MTIKQQLEQIFGFPPYPYQVKVAEVIRAGRNVVLQAPTGGGKSEAVLGPYLLERLDPTSDFPLKMMLGMPMKTLARSLIERVRTYTDTLPIKLDVRLHTGEDQNAPLLEGDILVTTLDQILSNYAHIPLSMSNNRANIGGGAVISSYVVFDEFHLFDPERAYRTALLMAEQLAGITPFVFMTATLSSEVLAKIATKLNAELIVPTPTELDTMGSQQKTRMFKRVEHTLTATAVLKHHHRRSLALCNTVARAQKLYEDLQAQAPAGTQVHLVHSQAFPSHRRTKEIQLESWMGKGSSENVILVGTQAVEVGLNLSSEALHTELCPANSLLQRAGRCARFEGEVGTVYVYALEGGPDGKISQALPYRRELLEAAWEALPTLEGKVVGFAEEAGLIDTVHTEQDRKAFKAHVGSIASHAATLRKAQIKDGNDDIQKYGLARELIRDVQNQSVLLHAAPDSLDTWRKISEYELVGVFTGKLGRLLTRAGTDPWGATGEWVAKYPVEDAQEDGEKRRRKTLRWEVCHDPATLRLQPLVALNPRFVCYDPEEGLVLEREGPSPLPESPKKLKPTDPGEREDFWYTFETYQLHIERVMGALEKYAPEVLRIAPRVDRRFSLPPGTLEHCIRVAIAAHDLGKLSSGWQGWSRAWQQSQLERYPDWLWDGAHGQRKVTPQSEGEYSAHTDYHPDSTVFPKIDDEKREKQFSKKRPGHAGESARLFQEGYGRVLIARAGDVEKGKLLGIGVYAAIMRHHGAGNSGQTGAWTLDAGAALEGNRVFELLIGARMDAGALAALERPGVSAADPSRLVPHLGQPLAWLTYALVVRALRQSDSNSFPRDEGEAS